MKLNIITLSWNGMEKLQALYPTLLKSLGGINYTWMIKDNGSTDESIKKINDWKNENVIVYGVENNRDNFSQGCNYLFNKIESDQEDNDLVLLLNNDIIFNDSKSISNMISLFRDDQVGVVGSKLKYTYSDKIQHAGVVFSAKTHKLPTHYRVNTVNDNSFKNKEFQAVTGACLMTSYRDMKKVGGLDHNFVWAFEDIDFCLKIKYNLNKKIILCEDTDIFHEESSSLKKNPINKLYLNHNISTFQQKWDNKVLMDKELYFKDKNYNNYL